MWTSHLSRIVSCLAFSTFLWNVVDSRWIANRKALASKCTQILQLHSRIEATEICWMEWYREEEKNILSCHSCTRVQVKQYSKIYGEKLASLTKKNGSRFALNGLKCEEKVDTLLYIYTKYWTQFQIRLICGFWNEQRGVRGKKSSIELIRYARNAE